MDGSGVYKQTKGDLSHEVAHGEYHSMLWVWLSLDVEYMVLCQRRDNFELRVTENFTKS